MTAPPPASPRGLRIWLWAVFALYLAACLHEAFGPFLVGHDGFNGAAFSQAARNSLRFGVLQQVQYYSGFESPPLSEVYTNHPMLLHIHLMGLFSVLGDEPWVARLVPITYSVGLFLLIHRIVARRAGAAAGAAAVTLWALTPLHTIFANMVNHEQGSLFWCLLLLDRYHTRHQTLDDPKALAAREWPIHLAVGCAMQFDWVGYYLAAFIGLHALRHAIWPTPGGAAATRSLGRRLGFLARFSATVLLNATLFFGWIAWLRGGLGAMVTAFQQRSASSPGYLDVLLDRSLDLYGPLLLALAAGVVLRLAVRLVRGRFDGLDFITLGFAFAQVIHSTVFQNAGAIHSYWTYSAGPGLAIGGACLVRDFALAASRGNWPLGRGATTSLVAVAVCVQAVWAVGAHLRGHADHRGSYLPPTPDEYLETRWAEGLSQRFGRDGTCYLVHPSAERAVHLRYLLDAPLMPGARHLSSDTPPSPPRGRCRRAVLLVDLSRMSAHETARFFQLGRKHGVLLHDRRFGATDLASRQPGADDWLEAVRFEPASPSPLFEWLVYSGGPRLVIVPDPEATHILASSGTERGASAAPVWAGRPSGSILRATCPEGAAVTALGPTSSGEMLDGLLATCATQPGAVDDGPMTLATPLRLGRMRREAAPPTDMLCPDAAPLAGLRGRGGALVDAIGLLCAPRVHPKAPREHQQDSPRRPGRLEGGPGGSDFDLPCAPGEILTGLAWTEGTWLEALSPICTPAPAWCGP